MKLGLGRMSFSPTSRGKGDHSLVLRRSMTSLIYMVRSITVAAVCEMGACMESGRLIRSNCSGLSYSVLDFMIVVKV